MQQWGRPAVRRRCRKDPGNTIGIVMIAAGLLLLFLCIPGWAWAALAGAALILGGYLLIRR